MANLGTNRANRIGRAVMRRLAGLDLPKPHRTAGSESPDNWAMAFVTAAVLLFGGQAAYALWFRRQKRAGRREWSPTILRISRSGIMAALTAGLLYALIGGAPPLAAFPTTVKLALPLLVGATVSLLLLAAWVGLWPIRKIAPVTRPY